MPAYRRNRQRHNPVDNLEILGALSGLSKGLRLGLNQTTARQIASAVRTVLAARAVAVTEDDKMLANNGEDLPWQAAVEERARTVLDRRRNTRPTLYQLSLGREQLEVAVAVLTTGPTDRGTIHVVARVGHSLAMRELQELAAIVSSQLELAELEQSQAYAAEAELRALQAQISPHFVHNALTTIAGLIPREPTRARSLVVTMADFLRASFRTQTDLTTVADELALVEAYLELEQARFGDRFEVSLNIAPEALPVRLPFLAIQSLVENAFRHGLEKRPGAGSLVIVAEDLGPEIAIHVEDDGVGINPAQLEQALSGTGSTPHVGLLAVDTRLRSHFGPERGLTISTGTNAGTKVTLRLPKNAASHGDRRDVMNQ